MRRRDRNSAYAVVLADLKGQRDDLDRMIRMIEVRMADPGGSETKAENGDGEPVLTGESPAVKAASA